MKAVIMAGGKGVRIAAIAGDVPKPMMPILGKPLLERQTDCLKSQGLRDIWIVCGHLGDRVRDYFSNRDLGLNIHFFQEDEPLGTAGALAELWPELQEDFLLINGDVLFDMDLSRFIAFHKSRKALATVAAHPNGHPYDSAVIRTDECARVTGWTHPEEGKGFYNNLVNAGIHILSPELFRDRVRRGTGKLDLDRDILKPAVGGGGIYAYKTPEYIRDIGTPARYEAACRDAAAGIPAMKNIKNLQKAVFLDRDGVINVPKGFIRRWQELELAPGAAQAIARINRSAYLAVVITNQPVIARGDCDMEELSRIHQYMEMLLGKEGAYVDGLFFCPHHPEKGFAGERPEYKTDCECRKPKPGMLYAAAQRYHIELGASYMAGDSLADIQAARGAGVQPVYIGDGAPEWAEAAGGCLRYRDLYQCIRDIIG
jgi:D-glycero-D-manno-heptose 1,7-bisphosphate phosphatase